MLDVYFVLINLMIFKHSPVHKELQIAFIWDHGFGFTNLCFYSYENICVTLSNTSHNRMIYKIYSNRLQYMLLLQIKRFNLAYKTDFSRTISVWHHICLDLHVSVVFTSSSVQSQVILSTVFIIKPSCYDVSENYQVNVITYHLFCFYPEWQTPFWSLSATFVTTAVKMPFNYSGTYQANLKGE